MPSIRRALLWPGTPLARSLDLLTNRAVEVVVTVEAGGPARVAGVRAGDLIITVNERIVVSVDDLHRVLSGFPKAGTLRLTLVCQKQLLEVIVHPKVEP